MEAKHTPGPWHIGMGNGEGSVFAAEGRMRAEDRGTTLYPICDVIDFDGECAANAALIAAAPELLELCEFSAPLADDAAAYLTGEEILPNDDATALAESLATLAMRLRSIIAKAKGEKGGAA